MRVLFFLFLFSFLSCDKDSKKENISRSVNPENNQQVAAPLQKQGQKTPEFSEKRTPIGEIIKIKFNHSFNNGKDRVIESRSADTASAYSNPDFREIRLSVEINIKEKTLKVGKLNSLYFEETINNAEEKASEVSLQLSKELTNSIAKLIENLERCDSFPVGEVMCTMIARMPHMFITTADGNEVTIGDGGGCHKSYLCDDKENQLKNLLKNDLESLIKKEWPDALNP